MTLAYWLQDRYQDSPDFIRQTVGAVAGRLPDAWRYGPAFANAWRLLEASRTWSEAELAEYQLVQLRGLLAFAGQHVPYYRRLFAERGFRPDSVQSPDDLGQLPLLTRAMARRLGRELSPDNLRPGSYKFSMTSGTSGYPLGFSLSYDASAAEWAYMLYHWQYVGCRPGDLRMVVGSRPVRGRDRGRWWYYDPVNHMVRFSVYDMNPATLPQYVAAMKEYRPFYYHGFPTGATLLAQYLDRQGDRLPSMRGLMLASENIYPGQRAYLERVFGCPTYNWYGLSEKCILAVERPGSSDYHPLPQYGVTELVDTDGRPITEPGQRGQLVGTGFLNRASVFIRYLTDDDAEWAAGPCACGCCARRLCRIRGRWNQELLLGRTGALFPPAYMITREPVFTRMQRFQFYQDTPGEAVLRIVKTPEFTPADETAILDKLKPRLNNELLLKIEYVDDLPAAPSGKFQFVIQRLALDYPRWEAENMDQARGVAAGSLWATSETSETLRARLRK